MAYLSPKICFLFNLHWRYPKVGTHINLFRPFLSAFHTLKLPSEAASYVDEPSFPRLIELHHYRKLTEIEIYAQILLLEDMG